MTEYLLQESSLSSFAHRVKENKHLLLFLDYDGTLSFFHEDPAQAVPLPGIESLLQALRDKIGIQICLISGRPIEDLKKLLSLDGIYYVGLHGLEITTPDGTRIFPSGNINEISSELTGVRDYLQTRSAHSTELSLEDKGPVLTVHHLPEINQNRLSCAIRKIIDIEEMEIVTGRQVIEVRPRGWHKGQAVQYLVEQIGEEESCNPLVIYLGDDSTDEDAFRKIKKWKSGFAIYIQNEGDLKTEAGYYLHGPEEVKTLLEKIRGLC